MTRDEFYNSIEKWISAPKEGWNHITLMAYFFHKYEKKNGSRYMPTTWRGNPGSTKECKDISKIFNNFAPDDYKTLSSEEKKQIKSKVNRKIVNYINWMFDYKYRYGNKGRAITTQFFLAPYALNEFQIMYDSAIRNFKSKNTIAKLVSWCKKEAPSILDNHELDSENDLKLIAKYAEMYSLESSSDEMRVISKAKAMGII